MSTKPETNDKKFNSPSEDLGASVVEISNLTLQYGNKTVLKDLNWIINRKENWLLGGESGSGKSTLVKIIADLHTPYGSLTTNFNPQQSPVLFVDSWYQFKNKEGVSNFYYQQRYTSVQVKDVVSVKTEFKVYGEENNLNFSGLDTLIAAFDFQNQLTASLIELSSGEHKKLQLIKALWLKPQLLIIDQPYTGLDFQSRKNLNQLINQLAAENTQFILIANDDEIPSCVNKFAKIEHGQLVEKNSKEQLLSKTFTKVAYMPDFLKEGPNVSAQQMVYMQNVNISYGSKQVLNNINWEIKAGEKWLLQGHNGSGKSTLLSLINGDHPQAYANEIYLFGNKRGSGESIWDIKQKIGTISPELHWYFDASSTVFDSVASGFFDSNALYQKVSYNQTQKVNDLLAFFDLESHKNEILKTLPLGKQRLVLLARTIIKNPEILILDEPCQGLDNHQTRHFNQMVDLLCKNGMTLIYVGHFETQLPSCIEHKIILENGLVKSVVNLQEKELVQ